MRRPPTRQANTIRFKAALRRCSPLPAHRRSSERRGTSAIRGAITRRPGFSSGRGRCARPAVLRHRLRHTPERLCRGYRSGRKSAKRLCPSAASREVERATFSCSSEPRGSSLSPGRRAGLLLLGVVDQELYRDRAPGPTRAITGSGARVAQNVSARNGTEMPARLDGRFLRLL
jgi:hypothetical protein